MKKPFDETKIGAALSGFIDLFVAGFWWMLCSLPIITAGAACTALYYTVVKSVRHERGRVTSTFFGAFKSNFKSSIWIWLAFLLYLAVGAGDVIAVRLMGESAGIFRTAVPLFFVPGALLLPWLFPYVSRFENSFGGSIKASFYLSIKYFGKTLIMLLIAGGIGFICWLLPQLIPLFPGVTCLLMSFQSEPAFKTLTADMEDGNADQWYNE